MVGMRDRHQRQQRLARSIELIPEQLRDILPSKWEHEDDDWLKWTPEVLFTYVLRTFETGVVSQASAEGSLRIVSAAILFVTFLQVFN
jgi:hypothetical protein